MKQEIDPIWAILDEQGRNKKWLARKVGMSHGYVRLIACGAKRASTEFRKRSAIVMGMPESSLFLAAASTVEADTRQSEVA